MQLQTRDADAIVRRDFMDMPVGQKAKYLSVLCIPRNAVLDHSSSIHIYIYRLYILQCTLNLQVISCFIYLLTNTGCLSPSSTICMSAHETALNTFETSVVGRAVSPYKTCVHSSKNHDPARKCDRLYTLLYLKHDQIHISIAYRCILYTVY